MPSKKEKITRFQVDQVGDAEEVDTRSLADEKDTFHFSHYYKSFRHYLTRDALPNEYNYRSLRSVRRDSERVSGQSSNDQQVVEVNIKDRDVECSSKPKSGRLIKLGWINGVYVRRYLALNGFNSILFRCHVFLIYGELCCFLDLPG